MAEYATRLANSIDTAERMRLTGTMHMAANGPLEAKAGLRPDGGGACTVVDGAMQVDVDPFIAWVDGGSAPTQAGYVFVLDTTKTLTLTDGDVAADRVDLIVARVYDDAYDGSGSTTAAVEVIDGDPLTPTTPPAVPVGAIPLQEVQVPAGRSAGTGGLDSSNLLTDRRTYTASLGGRVVVGSATERDAMTPMLGQEIWRSDKGWTERWDGTQWIGPVFVFLHAATAPSVTPGGTTLINWDAVDEPASGVLGDVGASESAGTVTLPPGVYAVAAQMSGSFSSGTNNFPAQLQLFKNAGMVSRAYVHSANAGSDTAQVGRTVRIAVGDTLQVFVTNHGSNGGNWDVAGGEANTYLSLVRISD